MKQADQEPQPRGRAVQVDAARIAMFAERWVDRILLAVIAINCLLLTYFICRGYSADFHTDSAMKNLIAQEIVDTGNYFPADWNYVNGDLWVVFGQAFIAPLLPFTGNGYALHAFAGLVSAALILWGIWLVTGLLQSTWRARLIVLAVFSGSISMQVAENLYGQVSYGSVVYMCCFQLYATWRLLQSSSRRAMAGWAALLLALGALAFWSNPQRAAAYFLVPLLCAVLVHAGRQLFECARLQWADCARPMVAIIVLFVGGLLGALLHSWALAGANNIAGVGSSKWLAFPDVVRNLGLTVQGLFAIMGGTLTPGASVMSAGGAVEGGRLLLSILTLGLVPFAVLAAIRSRQNGTSFVATFTAVLLFVFLFLQVFTTTADMSDPVNSSRYMLPAVMFGLIVLFGSIGNGWADRRISWLAVLATLGLVAGTYLPGNPLSRAFFGMPRDSRGELVHFLESEGLKYGYATYWNSGALTVLSDFNVRVRQIWLESGDVLPYRHLNSNRWYLPEAWKEETFLMLTDQELATVDWARFERYAGAPQRRLRHNDMNILVFKDNLSARLPFWSNDIVAEFPIGPSSPHTTGEYKLGGSDNLLVARSGEVGYLHYGPYMTLGPGRYRAELVLAADPMPGSNVVGRFDATVKRGEYTLAEADISSAHEVTSIEFTLPKTAQGFELRVWVNGSTIGSMKALRLRRLGAADSLVERSREPNAVEQG